MSARIAATPAPSTRPDAHTRAKVIAEADISPAAFDRWLRGDPTRGATDRRIERALRKLGLTLTRGQLAPTKAAA